MQKLKMDERSEAIKLLKENIGETLHDNRFGNDFFGYDTKSTGNKRKK